MPTVELISEYPVPARRVFELIRSPAFQEAVALRGGAQEVVASEVRRREDLLQVRIEESRRPAEEAACSPREPAGRSVTLHDFDCSGLSSRWTRHQMDQGQAASIEGELVVEPRGEEACRVVERAQVEIKHPVLGRALERRLVSELQALFTARADLLVQQLGIDL
jgi:hypothetical protein